MSQQSANGPATETSAANVVRKVPVIDLQTFTWSHVNAVYEGKDEKGISEIIEVTKFPAGAKSLPLFEFPFGRTIEEMVENQKDRGDIPVQFEFVDKTFVRVTFKLDELYPQLGVKTNIEHPSRYTFQFTPLMLNDKWTENVLGPIIVDTSPFSRSVIYPNDMDLSKLDDVEDGDLDPPLLIHYATGKETEKAAIAKEKRLTDQYEKHLMTAERRFDQIDGKTFDCVRLQGEYGNPIMAKKYPAPYFDVIIVPMRTQYDYDGFFASSTEHCLIFRSMTCEFPIRSMPDPIAEWMNQMANDLTLRGKHSYKNYIEEELKRRHETTHFWSEPDLDAELCIPISDNDRLDEYLGEWGQVLYAAYQEQQSPATETDTETKTDATEEKEEDVNDEIEGDEVEEFEEGEEEEDGENEEEDEDDEGYLEFINDLNEHVGDVAEQLRSLLEMRCKESIKFLQLCETHANLQRLNV